MNSFADFPANDASIFLAQVDFFACADPQTFIQITRNAQTRKFQADQVVCSVGDQPRTLFVVLSGLIKRALLAECGHESVADLITPGRYFGDTELFSQRPFGISAVAVEPTEVLCIDGESIRKAVEQDSRWASHLISLMARGRLSSDAERAIAPTRSSCERVLDYLLDLAEKSHAEGWGTTVRLMTTKQLIAARIGLTPETFSRALRQLSDEGKILVDGRHVTLREMLIESWPSSKAATQSVRPSLDVGRIEISESPTLNTINIAGRQRMLSQRMSKFWLMIQHGITVRHAQNKLQQAMAEFELQMIHLHNLTANDKIAQSLKVLDDIWRVFRMQLLHADAGDTDKVLSQGEQVMRAANELTAKYVAFVNDASAQLVNLAGRQRMLSQHIAKLYVLQHSGAASREADSKLHAARQEFSKALLELLRSANNHPVLKRQLRLVSSQWSAMSKGLDDPSQTNAARSASQISLASERVVKQLDNVVVFYSTLKKVA